MTENDKLVSGSSEEITYYQVIRSTLHSLDGIRLTAAVSGLTVCTSFIIVAITIIHYVGVIAIFSTNVPAGQIISIMLCFISARIAKQFIRKIDLFNHFIDCAVEIALRLEEKLLPDKKLRLTAIFNKHEFAGHRGDQLFKNALKLILFSAWVGVVMSGVAIIYKIYKG